MKTVRSGYIILLTLLIISLAVVLVTYLFVRGSIFVPYADVMIKREKARQLALGGLQVACGQLSIMPPKTDQASPTQEKKSPEEVEAQFFLTYLLPRINQWQTFDLKKERDGIQGTIKIVLTSEEGKIDVNAIYDFRKHAFITDKRDWKKFLQEVVFKQLQTILGKTGLFESFEKFLKARQDKLNDVTELLLIPEFAVFKNMLYFEPSVKVDEKQQRVDLTDLFTIFGKDTLEPWLLSPSVQTVLGITPRELTKEIITAATKQFKKTAHWSQDWNTMLRPLYAKELQSLPKGIDSMLSSTFDPQLFSVLSYGSIGNVTQRVYALVERIKQNVKGKTFYDVKIRKIYWL